jgi:hypothetical protein
MLYCDWLETGQYFERKGVVKNGNVW